MFTLIQKLEGPGGSPFTTPTFSFEANLLLHLRLMSVISAVRQSLEESCGGRVGQKMDDEH